MALSGGRACKKYFFWNIDTITQQTINTVQNPGKTPYKHRTRLLNNNFHKKNFDNIIVFLLMIVRCLFGACLVHKKENIGWGRCLVGACTVHSL